MWGDVWLTLWDCRLNTIFSNCNLLVGIIELNVNATDSVQFFHCLAISSGVHVSIMHTCGHVRGNTISVEWIFRIAIFHFETYH